jgi:hypothetical protein
MASLTQATFDRRRINSHGDKHMVQGKFGVYSWDECQMKCQETPKCMSWHSRPENGFASFMKSMVGAPTGKQNCWLFTAVPNSGDDALYEEMGQKAEFYAGVRGMEVDYCSKDKYLGECYKQLLVDQKKGSAEEKQLEAEAKREVMRDMKVESTIRQQAAKIRSVEMKLEQENRMLKKQLDELRASVQGLVGNRHSTVSADAEAEFAELSDSYHAARGHRVPRHRMMEAY